MKPVTPASDMFPDFEIEHLKPVDPQSFGLKTLTDDDLDKINKLIISTVENKTGAKIRS